MSSADMRDKSRGVSGVEGSISHGVSSGMDRYPEDTEEVILPQRIFMFCVYV